MSLVSLSLSGKKSSIITLYWKAVIFKCVFGKTYTYKLLIKVVSGVFVRR